MRLLLDVHHSRLATERLRLVGYDVEAAASGSTLARLADDDLLRAAKCDERFLVTEDVSDCNRLVRAWAAVGEHQSGIIFTPAPGFPRSGSSYPNDLVEALVKFLSDAPATTEDWVHCVR